MPSLKNFLFQNQRKDLTLKAYIISAFYRACIKFLPDKKLEIFMGIKGQESATEEDIESLKEAKRVGIAVNNVTSHTPWESKCLVRALTARKLLMQKKIPTTLYLGVGKDENGQMVAHAWLRCGQLYVTGGNGETYAMVAKFKSM